MFAVEVVSPPAHLPVSATDEALAAAVVEEIERTVLWRAVVRSDATNHHRWAALPASHRD